MFPSSADSSTEPLCDDILRVLLPYRRGGAGEITDPAELAPQRAQLAEFVSVGDPITLTLPAFPCKSPNPAKVLGTVPDLGERLSLRFLDRLCAEIRAVYAPGARVLICSDGHVFADSILVPDETINEYAAALRTMIDEESEHIDTFDLRNIYGDLSYDAKRETLMAEHGQSLEALRAEIESNPNTLRLYQGINRFLWEDSAGPAEGQSRSALKRDCRQRAQEVIRRSRAWGELIKQVHPRSFRLSIHPQPAGSEKFGIVLLGRADDWKTPWHAVAVQHDGEYSLVKRSDAESYANLVRTDGVPSHFEVTSSSSAPTLEGV